MKAAIVVLLASFATAAVAATPRVEPGLWRIKTLITNNGVPEPVIDEEVCATAEEVKDLSTYFALAPPEGLPARCASSQEPAKAAGTLAFRMRCKGKDVSIDLRATVSFPSHQRYLVEARSDARDHGKAVVAITKAEARHVGPCPTQ
jgi:hypothetical protein